MQAPADVAAEWLALTETHDVAGNLRSIRRVRSDVSIAGHCSFVRRRHPEAAACRIADAAAAD